MGIATSWDFAGDLEFLTRPPARVILRLRADLALLPEPKEEPQRLGFDYNRNRSIFGARVVVPVDAIVVHHDRVTFTPVVALAIVQFVTAALQNVEESLILMPVSVIAPARRENDEVRLQTLRPERLLDPGR